MGYVALHRDVESLVFALIELRKVEDERGNGVAPEERAARFREVVGAFAPTAFTDEESQWSLAPRLRGGPRRRIRRHPDRAPTDFRGTAARRVKITGLMPTVRRAHGRCGARSRPVPPS
ncbi:hypothetical protein ABZY81_33755 [Streptomyces sp. NPDC006514]|uniref:hypothetical protein n=1 Tax=Streptomyces sp. NPDC006514 TaxID=3154308 RepID=UPI0033BB830F